MSAKTTAAKAPAHMPEFLRKLFVSLKRRPSVIALIVLMPVYTKLLRKINTSIVVEGNGDLGEIDISGED